MQYLPLSPQPSCHGSGAGHQAPRARGGSLGHRKVQWLGHFGAARQHRVDGRLWQLIRYNKGMTYVRDIHIISSYQLYWYTYIYIPYYIYILCMCVCVCVWGGAFRIRMPFVNLPATKWVDGDAGMHLERSESRTRILGKRLSNNLIYIYIYPLVN